MATSITKVDTKQFEIGLARLKAEADFLVVKDAESCLKAKTGQRNVRDQMKAIHLVLDPFVNSAKLHLQEARDELSKYIGPCEAIDEALAQKVKDYERLERERAAAEERRINEERRRQAAIEAEAQRKRDEQAAAERRKEEMARISEAQKAGELKKRAADLMRKEAEERASQERLQAKLDAEAAKNSVQDVKVQAAIPTVAGVPSRRNYRAEVTDQGRFIKECAKRIMAGDDSLAGFLMINGSAVGAEAREMKDSKAFMAKYPFCRAWED